MTKNEFIQRCVIALASNPMYHTLSTLTPETDYILDAAEELADRLESDDRLGDCFDKPAETLPCPSPKEMEIINDIIDNAW